MKINYGNPCIMGVTKLDNKYNFSLSSSAANITLLLYQKDTKSVAFQIDLDEKYKIGTVFSVSISDIDLKDYQYHYKIQNSFCVDPYAKTISDCSKFGIIQQSPFYVSCVELEEFDWEDDKPLGIPYSESIIYKLHVRGYTKSRTSGITSKGTFAGIMEKIPYLKELGITTIQLMPAYEFEEITRFQEFSEYNSFSNQGNVNYWGYTNGLHFAPKASFCKNANKQADYTDEFKQLVKELHKNNIEIIMEMYFEKETPQLISDCIRYWVLEYHIDGVHLYGNDTAFEVVALDPILSDTKILTETNDEALDRVLGYSSRNTYKKIGNYSTQFSNVIRRFLKGDEDQLVSLIHLIKNNPINTAVINYITNHNGFTLYDLVSYDRKHNDANGEGDRDGENYNFSWNCGVEGKTRSKKIIDLRQRQVKNAFMLLLLSQGTPLLLAGDEMENSQGGNNNPYCLDNETSWINWNETENAKEIFEFVKDLIEFRKQHHILHMEHPLHMADYRSCGYPDISFHGDRAWYTQFENYNRHVGVMFCSKYAKSEAKDELIYVAFNMHWENHDLALPVIAENCQWEVCMNTTMNKVVKITENRTARIEPRSIAVIVGKSERIRK